MANPTSADQSSRSSQTSGAPRDLYPAAAATKAGQGRRAPAGAAAAAGTVAAATAAVADAPPAAAALPAGHQLYRIEDLQQRAEAVEAAGKEPSRRRQQQGARAVQPAAAAAAAAAAAQEQDLGQGLAVVPDSNRPFTITMHNPRDGRDYVVAHYEPHALQHATLSSSSSSSSSTKYSAGGPAADLCEVFHSRDRDLLLQRTSAAERDRSSGQDP
ncbi:hypothetical protein OEZ85_014103 [Tetradesmus obliquus]|uniref:Uncharacterized protein n=1 Tax=Tetradesmus obliquus TaxID=3088 RepID=A0ABY8U7Y4_TETOB|nr:hypothetical protein OEZ85_014103 [Tetradesmus obliquus]